MLLSRVAGYGTVSTNVSIAVSCRLVFVGKDGLEDAKRWFANNRCKPDQSRINESHEYRMGLLQTFSQEGVSMAVELFWQFPRQNATLKFPELRIPAKRNS